MAPSKLVTAIKNGVVPEPTVLVGRRRYYTAAVAERVRAALTVSASEGRETASGLLTIRRAAQLVQANPSTFQKWLIRGVVDRPTHGDTVNKFYKLSELGHLRKQIGNRGGRAAYRRLHAQGYRRLVDLGRDTGLALVTVRKWVRLGKIPAPTYTCTGLRSPIYTPDEVRTLRRVMADRKKSLRMCRCCGRPLPGQSSKAQ